MALVERYHSSQELKEAIAREALKPGIQQCSNSKSLPGNKQGISLVHSEERAKHVGILALEVYFPDTYVRPNIHSQDFGTPTRRYPAGGVPHNGSIRARKAAVLQETSPATCLCIASMSGRALQASQEDLKACDSMQPADCLHPIMSAGSVPCRSPRRRHMTGRSLHLLR
jgi:hypothetical protein